MTESHLLGVVVGEVKAEMARQDVNQRHLAEVLGISQVQVSERLRGKVAFNVPELELVARFLGVPVTQFLSRPERAA